MQPCAMLAGMPRHAICLYCSNAQISCIKQVKYGGVTASGVLAAALLLLVLLLSQPLAHLHDLGLQILR